MKAQVLVVPALAFTMLGCSAVKDEAIEAGVEIRQLCKDKKNDQANSRGVEMYEKNVVFKQAVDDSAAVWKIKEIATYNYCGPAFIDGQRKIAEAKDPEGCSCAVIGASDGTARAGWLLLGLSAIALRRRGRRR